MSISARHAVWIVAASTFVSSCAPRTIDIAQSSDARTDAASLDVAPLGLLLHRIVAGEQIDADKLLANRELLDAFLASAARVGPAATPDLFPDADSRVAYWINCHNAALLRSLVALARDGHSPERLPGDLDRRFAFVVDGEPRTPAALRQLAVSAAKDDWRVRLAMCTVRQDGPALRREVLLGDMLDGQLDGIARQALASARVVRISHAYPAQLLVWEGLYAVRASLIAEHHRRVKTTDGTLLSFILDWSDRFRRETLNSAVGYEIVAMPVDTRLNAVGSDTAAP